MIIGIFERDLIATLGLLAHNFVLFDPPFGADAEGTHLHGYNVHAMVVDNDDGELLAIGRNAIFESEDPTQHAEQIAIRDALLRKKSKNPRALGVTVDRYYKHNLFMASGTAETDFYSKGCTLYNTFDPCGYCAVTLLVCYMKRIAFIFDDEKYNKVYEFMKANYFKGRESVKEQAASIAIDLRGTWMEIPTVFIREFRHKVRQLEANGVPLVRTIDQCRIELEEAAKMLWNLKEHMLVATDKELDKNIRLLSGIRQNIGGI